MVLLLLPKQKQMKKYFHYSMQFPIRTLLEMKAI